MGEVIVIFNYILKIVFLVVEKVLKFVIVNVEYNYEMDINNLVVEKVFVDEGLMLKCFCLCVMGCVS